MEKKYKFLGCNDDVDYCELCGRVGLKKVIWLENINTGEILPYGSCCGAKLQNISSAEFKDWLKNEKEKIKKMKCKQIFIEYKKGVQNIPANQKLIDKIKKMLKEAKISFSYFNNFMKWQPKPKGIFKIK